MVSPPLQDSEQSASSATGTAMGGSGTGSIFLGFQFMLVRQANLRKIERERRAH